MSIQSAYRRMPAYFAVPLALLASAVAAVALVALGVLTLDFLLEKFHVADGPGAGVLIVCAIPNIAVPVFVACFSILINWHHTTSWRTPTVAFALGATLVGVWAPFRMDVNDFLFAPFVLGTGAVAWIVSCWLLHRKLNANSEHVIEA
jgi:hypothetical protein